MTWFKQWYQRGLEEENDIEDEDDEEVNPESFDETCFLKKKPVSPERIEVEKQKPEIYSQEKSKQIIPTHRVLHYNEELQGNGLNRNLQETLKDINVPRSK